MPIECVDLISGALTISLYFVTQLTFPINVTSSILSLCQDHSLDHSYENYQAQIELSRESFQ